MISKKKALEGRFHCRKIKIYNT